MPDEMDKIVKAAAKLTGQQLEWFCDEFHFNYQVWQLVANNNLPAIMLLRKKDLENAKNVMAWLQPIHRANHAIVVATKISFITR